MKYSMLLELYDEEISNEDFSNADLTGAIMSHCTFHKCNFRETELGSCYLSYSKFIECDFTGAKLSSEDLYSAQVSFIKCKLNNAIISLNVDGDAFFDESDLTGAIFKDSDLLTASFKKAICDGVDFTGIDYDYQQAEDMHLNKDCQDPRLRFQEASLKGATFEGLFLNHAQFQRADLTDANFNGCDLSSELVDLIHWPCGYYSEGTSFEGATLKNTNFEGANLEGLGQATLSNNSGED